eukprot:TRINITY_DN3917_c0_g1_i1.p1 TRINITY_DN3917_c0_g1~~TRINITY_DN3917_c0_g1_i1.p1  ORF type:complete len:261 (+),score=39.26 TRINITY_DN3917_c0_g1_i1:759-1541(+)
MSSMSSPRNRHLKQVVDDRAPIDADYGSYKTLARCMEDSANNVSTLSSSMPRFKEYCDRSGLDWRAQDRSCIRKDLQTTPRKYAVVATSTPRFKAAGTAQLGRDFYNPDSGSKETLATSLAASKVKYGGTAASTTPRFKTPRSEGNDTTYDTDKLFKASLATQIKNSSIKYNAFRSKVPRFEQGSQKSKLKKLDLDAIYEAELKRVTGQREPAEYYVPDYGSTRGVGQSVKHSKNTYKSCFGSKVHRFAYERDEEDKFAA